MKPDNVPLDVPLQMISYRYDAQGRRVSKAIYEKRTSTEPGSTRPAEWSPVDVVLFYYAGWNLMSEVSSAHPESSRRYIWGTDLSGTMQGAGGVGGLLGIAGPTGKVKHLPCTEVNGNIMGLIGAVSGELLTRWDYDAFGNVVTDWVKPGTQPARSPFKFSTKYQDEETGMYYYGFRYYSPETICWTARDPIEENGDINIYGMVANNAVNRYDVLGLVDSVTPEGTWKLDAQESAEYRPSNSGGPSGRAWATQFEISLKWNDSAKKVEIDTAAANIMERWAIRGSAAKQHQDRHVEDMWQIWRIVHDEVKKVLKPQCPTSEEFDCYAAAWKEEMSAFLSAINVMSACRHANPRDRMMIADERNTGQTRGSEATRYRAALEGFQSRYKSANAKYSACDQKFHGKPFNNVVFEEHKQNLGTVLQRIYQILGIPASTTTPSFPTPLKPKPTGQ